MDQIKWNSLTRYIFACSALFGASSLSAETDATDGEMYELKDFVIKEQQTANLRPVVTYESPISNLDFDPRIDLQARNFAEAQADVSIRGGIFENTGFRVGSATLLDPQTGHYFAELPIAPEMLEEPDVLTGASNALYGFNSTVGTLSYGFTRIQDGGSATAGFGDHDLNFQRIHQGLSGNISEDGAWTWGVEAEVSRSESDGTVRYNDHDFFRTTGRVQIVGPNSQTDIFAGYQSKFFGQFGMYTGEEFLPSNPFETENLKTRLFIVNHRQDYSEGSYLEATAYTRRHSDHYIFNRFSPNNSFIHETEVTSLGFSGKHRVNDAVAINYSGQFAADEIESTNLDFNFTSRSYYKLSVLPEYLLQLRESETLILRAGGTFDDTNRNDDEASIIADATWVHEHRNGNSDAVYLSYSETSQVVGYTAIGGDPNPPRPPLFASDPDLDREVSQNIELGVRLDRGNWSVESAIFYRWDDDLVDWTFVDDSVDTARSANNVDIETFGVELIITRQWKTVEAIASYTFLSKDEDYGDANIVGSFYALNFPEHRATFGLIWSPFENVEIRLDNELRSQEENDLRTSDDEAAFSHLGISYFPREIEGLELFFSFDKPWDEDFQEVPGTPGRGDQVAAGMTYSW